MPPQMALISMLTSETMPVSGLIESCMPLTEPFCTWVVSVAHNAVPSAPKRASLPSINSGLAAVAPWPSSHRLPKVDSNDMPSMQPNTNAPNLRRPVKLPIMKMMAIGISRMPISSSALDSGVGFSSGTLLFGPYQPPPFAPSCLAATIAATGPSGIFCVSIPALVSIGVACGPAANVEGTPCQVSSNVHTRHNGNRKRRHNRTTSA
ncbi:hypothetical protein D3C81_922870 [compost metagenome]